MKREIKGMLTGLGVTFKTMTKPAVTVQYPHEKEAPPTRARGVIALKEENCTVCMLCARQCPDWCIYIEGHKEKRPPRREGGRPRTVNALDRFDIDYALCMYCGICVEVCPFAVLFLFGIMMTRAPIGTDVGLDNDQRWLGALVGLFLLGVLAAVLIDAFQDRKVHFGTIQRTAQVADSIFSSYVIPFEVASVLL